MFWDLFVPLAYLMLFGLGFERMMAGSFVIGDQIPGYTAFLLPGVLAMVTFTVAMNTSWGFFMDKDSGIFYELLTYPITRPQFLVGKIGFSVLLGPLIERAIDALENCKGHRAAEALIVARERLGQTLSAKS
ncbi:MAG: ABC transporter permease [Gammaproteobacteria bacterium]